MTRGVEMEDRPQDRTEERRRRGPLGDEGEAEETRHVPRAGDATRGEEGDATHKADTTRGGTSAEEETGTRVIRTKGASSNRPGALEEEEEVTYPSGYFEATEQRESRLKEIYGGIDWLASFIGCIFALVCGGLLLLLLAGLLLAPLDFGTDLQNQTIDASVITGFVVIGVALFLAYFAGGYVAGRLVRFNGGRNGALTVGWGLLLAGLLAIFPAFLPGTLFRLVRDVVNESILPAIGNLVAIGGVGLGILIGAILLMVLGGFFGGRFGNRYHAQIDRDR